jgi:hypothetical protein
MPTIQRPQLDHVSFSWREEGDLFHWELDAQRPEILERSGFNREFGDPADAPSINTEGEGAKFIMELSGILSHAAAIKMDAGHKPANKIIATLKAIEKDPSLILNSGVEPEALATVALNYQRGEEKPGTFWFDVDRSDDVPPPDPKRVSEAASVAIERLESAAHSGRPHDFMLDYLGDRLLACFLRFNQKATRHSIATDGDRAQAAAGPFLEFLTVVIAPLNRFLVGQPPHYGAKIVSAPELARRALRDRGKTHIQRVRKFLLHLFRITLFFP